MRDDRFKELLNLHLDHRLSAEEARELETALKADPEKRRLFRSYALMQRGCAELFRRSAADAPAPQALLRALREAETRMTERRERRTALWHWGTWGSTAGLAAVVTLMVARVSQPGMVAEAESSRQQAATIASTGTAASSTVSVRSALPPHLTLAALGIHPERAPSQLSQWTEAEEVAREVVVPAWAQTSTANQWSNSSAAQSHFSTRPINAWSPSGPQIQAASFTFER